MSSFMSHCQDTALISDWICVDDNSSPSDRAAMAKAFPQFRFLWKGPEQAGHARSMNLILAEIRTPLLVHLEDDWEFSRDFRLGTLVEALEEFGAHQLLMVPRPNSRPLEHHPFELGRYIYRPNHPQRDQVAREYEAAHPPPPGDGGAGWWWPGFSLNPSLLDVEFFRTHVGQFDESLPPSVVEYDAAARAHSAGAVILCADLGVAHMGWVSAYSLNDQSRTWEPPIPTDCDSETPKIVHFIFQRGDSLDFLDYLAILSASVRIRPEAIYLYSDKDPLDSHWGRLAEPLITVERLEGSGERSFDIFRLEKLTERGGIALDLDCVVLNSFDDLLSHRPVLEAEFGAGLGVVMGPPGCRFFKLWLDRVTVVSPHQLARAHPELCELKRAEAFAPFPFHDESILQPMNGEQLTRLRSGRLGSSYAVRLWRNWKPRHLDLHDLDIALERNTLFSLVVRELLAESAPCILKPAPNRTVQQEAEVLAAQLDALARETVGQDWSSVRPMYEACRRAAPDFALPSFRIAWVERTRGHAEAAFAAARQARDLPLPKTHAPLPFPDLYRWIAEDELATCAYWVGRHIESFDRCTRLLTGTFLPDTEWDRVVNNRDFSVEQVKAAREPYPQSMVTAITGWSKGPQTDVTLTVTACKRPELLALTLNSFLNCCEDLHRIGRWICLDDGSSEQDCASFRQRYPFFELLVKEPAEKGHAHSMNRLREEVKTPYWLHLEDDWHFLAKQPYIALAQEILEEFDQVAQVLFNRNYAQTLACRHHLGGRALRTSAGRRFRLHEYLPDGSDELSAFTSQLQPDSRHHAYWPHFSLRPSLMRTQDILRLGPFDPAAYHFEMEFAERYAKVGLQSASLDVVNALHTGKLTWESGDNAYSLNQQIQFDSKAGESTDGAVGTFKEQP
jgi:hypothetical protein